MKKWTILLAAGLLVGGLACSAHAQGWDARQLNVPDTNKPWIEDPPGSGDWIINPAWEKTCWQAVAANQLSAAGYEPFYWEIYSEIYNRFLNMPGVPINASKWWLVEYGRNPDSFRYRPDNPYTDFVVHNTPGLFNPAGPDGPQGDDWPADGAHATDYNQLLDDLNLNRYVNIGVAQELEGGGHAMTLVGGNYAGNPNGNPGGNTSICHDPDTGPDFSEEGKMNTFDPWQMLWTVYYADVLCPGLRKPEYAERNYDVAYCYPSAGIFRDAGVHGNELDWDDYQDPEWVPNENTAKIYGEANPNRAGHSYLLVDYATAQVGDPQITVRDNNGNEAELIGSVRWSDSQSQALLHYRFIEYDYDENEQLMDARPYQPEFQTIEFPSDDYRDMEHSVVGWDVATFAAPEVCRTFYATTDPQGKHPADEAWTELVGSPDIMANELWFCHSNTYLNELPKYVNFTLSYIHSEFDPALYWDENDPALYGAGYYDEAFTPDFSNLYWSAEEPIVVGENGEPDPQGHYLKETLRIHLDIEDHPDWEWVKLLGGWDPFNYEILSATFDTRWFGLPGDVNGDGFVVGGDLNTIISNWGLTDATRAQGDLTGEGNVGGGDYNQVLAHWGEGLPPEPPREAIPEPATLGLFLLSSLALLRRRRGHSARS